MTEKTTNPTFEKQTEGVKTLLGEPKKAVIKLAVPMILAMLIQTIYNLADALWVSGLGANALAAVGFVFPFFMMIMALGTGIGLGSGSAISRKIGAQDKTGADNVAAHSMILLLIIYVIFSIPTFLFAEPLFKALGTGEVLNLTVSYAQVIFIGSLFIFFSNIANAILRGEGDAKRAMYALAFGSALNIILDPIFIYTLDMGVAGAAWATIISFIFTSILLSNWLFFKKNTFVNFSFKKFHFKKHIIKDIFGVGVPASFSQLSMSLSMLIINFLIVFITSGNTDGVAIYSTGWRVAMIAVLPVMGIATAVISVSGAAYGAKAYKKVNIAHLYSVKIGFIFELIIAILIFIFAPQIAAVFSRAESASQLKEGLTLFFRVMSLYYPSISLGMLSSALFQGVGKGLNAFIATLFRTLIFTMLFILVFAITLDGGLVGIWWGIVVANILSSIIVFIWARTYIKKLIKTILPKRVISKEG
jgi:putative MATE family efflux protein